MKHVLAGLLSLGLVHGLAVSAAAEAGTKALSDAQIRQILIEESIAAGCDSGHGQALPPAEQG